MIANETAFQQNLNDIDVSNYGELYIFFTINKFLNEQKAIKCPDKVKSGPCSSNLCFTFIF